MFMSWNLYFANWKRTETMSLLIKIASLLIWDFRPLFVLQSAPPEFVLVQEIFEAGQSGLPGLMLLPEAVPAEVVHFLNLCWPHKRRSRIFERLPFDLHQGYVHIPFFQQHIFPKQQSNFIRHLNDHVLCIIRVIIPKIDFLHSNFLQFRCLSWWQKSKSEGGLRQR